MTYVHIRKLFNSNSTYVYFMSFEVLQFLFSIVITSGFLVLIWLITRFHKPESLEVELADPKKEAALAVGYVIGLFLIITAVFFYLSPSVNASTRTLRLFAFGEALRQWAAYGAMSFIPVSVIVKLRKQSFQTVGVTKKNIGLSLAVGFIVSVLTIIINILSAMQEWSWGRFLSYNALFAFVYYLPVGLGEELMFRGFLQTRCTIWLGTVKGIILASTIMALVHLPQRIFVAGLEPLQALASASSLLPFSFLMGVLMLRTNNILGPSIVHTVANWISVL